MPSESPDTDAVDLYWIPLGAGTPVVQLSGRTYEAVVARRERRTRCDLYHAALEITTAGRRHAVEQAPVPPGDAGARGVVASGPVVSRLAGRLRVFRYEVRCWPDGRIPDLVHAVGGAVRVSDDPAVARRVIGVLPTVPTPAWGRDELGAGEMWNSNSVIAWALANGGADVEWLHPPPGGRAPGWNAGLVVAGRQNAAGRPTGG